MGWLTRNEAMHRLEMETPNRLWAYNFNPKYKEYFKIEKNKMFVRSDFVEKLLKRKNAPDIYEKLIEKYGKQRYIAKELARRTNIAEGTAYNLINKLCCAPIALRVCATYEVLWEMAEENAE